MDEDNEVSLETAQAAKDDLEKAIKVYADTVNPGEYVSSWALISNRQSVEMERDNTEVVSLLVPSGQSFILTRGLLELALEGERMIG